MDLNSVQHLAARQGPLFWGAAAAAALGASLLVAALLLQVRKNPLRRAMRLPRRSARVGASPLGLARPAPGGYAPASRAAPLAAAAGPIGPDYDQALARLRRASEQLARLQQDGRESRLKATPGKADLLSRRGVG